MPGASTVTRASPCRRRPSRGRKSTCGITRALRHALAGAQRLQLLLGLSATASTPGTCARAPSSSTDGRRRWRCAIIRARARARSCTSRSIRRSRPARRRRSTSTSASRCRRATAPFGCIHGDCTLTGFYPMVAPRRPGAGLDAMPGARPLSAERRRARRRRRRGQRRAARARARRAGSTSTSARPSGLTLMVGRPRLRSSRRSVRGVRIVYLSPTGRGLPSPPEHVLPYQPANRVDRVLDTAAEAVELLGEIGAPLPPGEEVRIVGGPLRIQLAQTLPGVVLGLRSALRHLSAAALPQVPRVRAGARHLRGAGSRGAPRQSSAPTTSAGRPAPARVVSRRSLHAALVSQGRVRARDPGLGQLHPGDRSRHVRAAGAVRLVVLLHARGSRSAARQPRAVRQHAPDGQDGLHQAARSARHARRRPAHARAARRRVAARRRRRRCAASRSTGSGSSGSGPIRTVDYRFADVHAAAPRQAAPGATSRASSSSASIRPSSRSRCAPPIARATSSIRPGTASAASTPTCSSMPAPLVGHRDRSARPARRGSAGLQRRSQVRRSPAAALEVHLQQLRRPVALLPDAGHRSVARLLAVAHPRSQARPALRHLSLGVDAGRHQPARTRYGFGRKITRRA